uniref:tetratricopeptide repeat protein n=1 Tax=Aliarcobacter sp. TaxID=2321116 RepID=UPI0040481BEF
MKQNSCFIHTSKLTSFKRDKLDSSIVKLDNEIFITYFENDTLDKFEVEINKLSGNSSLLYFLKKRISSSLISFISVIVILIAIVSVSIYEDILKKIIFETPFSWTTNDFISIFFVGVFFFGLLMMPSLLDGESSEFKNLISSWFNKDIRRLKKLKLAFSNFDKKTTIHLYNFDLENSNHWIWRLLTNTILNRFYKINFYIRNDNTQNIVKRLEKFQLLNIEINTEKNEIINKNIEILLSQKEQKLYTLMKLCSTLILKNNIEKKFISMELFEYCGKSFVKEEEQDSKNQLIFGFQNFINRSFEDFKFITQEKALQVYFTPNVIFKDLEEEEKRLAYYLRNHIEECTSYFENPISFLILYYYVKDIVLDKRRTIKILEKLIESIESKQQYELVDLYWFDIAGFMFDSKDFNNFENANNSYYRQLSIDSLNKLIVLFKRNGHFEQALLISKYLYEINPNKYAVIICSLHERMGNFEQALNSLPKNLEHFSNNKPNDIEVKYYQRKAWIIVSQRKLDLKEEGIKALEKLREMIFSHNEDNTPLWLWHYYNIKANYEEWNENYENAVKNYKKCLSIPILGAFEYGATFVNMAIAYRFIYLTQNTQEITKINKAIKLGKLGVLLKQSVGDRDEMPIVLHNQALNILYKISNTSIDSSLCNEVLNLTQDALLILDKTKSIKRLGMILIENHISKFLLKSEDNNIVKRLENQLEFLDENELNQLLNLYKQFRKVNKIEKLNFLEEKLVNN